MGEPKPTFPKTFEKLMSSKKYYAIICDLKIL